jgi:hypothetical protein
MMRRVPIRNLHHGGTTFAHIRTWIMITSRQQFLSLGIGQAQGTVVGHLYLLAYPNWPNYVITEFDCQSSLDQIGRAVKWQVGWYEHVWHEQR